jgi:hypothetical protein
MLSSLANQQEGGTTMNNAESGKTVLSEREFEELLRTAYESRQTTSMDKGKEPKHPLHTGVQQHTISCM